MMKFSLFKNDKSTVKDEFVLLGIIMICLASGIALFISRPSFWIIGQTFFVGAGVLLILTGVMFIPCLIYRFLNNDKKA